MALGRLRNELQTRLFQKSAIPSTTTNSNRPSHYKGNPSLAPLEAASGFTSIRYSSRLFFASIATTGRSRRVADLAAAITLPHPDQKPELSKVSSEASPTTEDNEPNRVATTRTITTTRSSPGVDVIQKWIILAEEVKVGPAIGFGASAIVFQGSYNGHNVALKTLKATNDGSSLVGHSQKLAREALVLSCCRHQNVLHFYGICLHPYHGISIVTQLMQGGSLLQYLQCRRHKLDTREVLSIAHDIAQGMHFLHSQGIIHRDLKSANVLLDEKRRAVIADLGVSHSASEDEGGACSVRSSEVGSYKWMAPELCEDENGNNVVTFKSDVYSFGMLLWELVTCKVPYEDYSPIQAAACVVMHGLRPTIPNDCFPPLKYLMEKCWAQSPSDRPDFSDVVDMLCIISSSRVGVDMCTMPQSNSICYF